MSQIITDVIIRIPRFNYFKIHSSYMSGIMSIFNDGKIHNSSETGYTLWLILIMIIKKLTYIRYKPICCFCYKPEYVYYSDHFYSRQLFTIFLLQRWNCHIFHYSMKLQYLVINLSVRYFNIGWAKWPRKSAAMINVQYQSFTWRSNVTQKSNTYKYRPSILWFNGEIYTVCLNGSNCSPWL